VFVTDLQGKILQANDAASELLGLREDQVRLNRLTIVITIVDLAANFPAREAGRVKVRVREPRANGSNELGKRRRLAGIHACAAGPTMLAGVMTPEMLPDSAGHAGWPPPPQKNTDTPPFVPRAPM
jgi:hypothetical protein